MVVTEMTCVSPEGRITPALPWACGMMSSKQAWKRIVDYVHTETDAKIALQLGHSGRKGSTRRGWEGIDMPLDSGQLAAGLGFAHALHRRRYRKFRAKPHERSWTRSYGEFVAAARRGARGRLRLAGIPLRSRIFAVELHFAADESCVPTNTAARSRIAAAIRLRSVQGHARGLAARKADERSHFRARLGAGRIDAGRRGAGGASVQARRGGCNRLFVRPGQQSRATGLRAHVSGAIFRPHPQRSGCADHRSRQHFRGRSREHDHRGGPGGSLRRRAPHLADPAWTLHEAAKQGFDEIWWPEQYLAGKIQLERNLARAALLAVQCERRSRASMRW